jgi:glycine dehydrogenase
MGYEPHAAYFATKEEYKRSCQEELSEYLQDADGNRASRMALQTRTTY